MGKITAEQIVEVFKRIEDSGEGLSFPDKWNATKKEIASLPGHSGLDFGQSWKSASGKAFEKIAIEEVLGILNDPEFKKNKVIAKRWRELDKKEKEDMQVPLRRKCDNGRIFISNEPDIVIFKDRIAVAILSCKSSLRDRVSMDLFWAEVNQRENRKFLVVSAEPMDKLGTHAKPKKPRRIAECLYERLYIVNGNTDYCSVVRPFKDLRNDLKGWFLND